MLTLAISPDETGYSVTENQNSLLSQNLDGGPPRTRLDQVGDSRIVTLQWTGGQNVWQSAQSIARYEAVRAFLRQNLGQNCPQFLMDLIIDTNEYSTYACNLLPNSVTMTAPGVRSWQIVASFEVGIAVTDDSWPGTEVTFFLNHFQNNHSANIASAVGPDMVPVGTAALSATQSKFGGNSGSVAGGTDRYTAAISPPIDMSDSVMGSWRIEGFFYDTVLATSNWLTFSGSGFIVEVGPTTNMSFGFNFDIAGALHDQGGALGSGADQPALDTWHHCGMQYDATNGNVSCFLDGTRFFTGLVNVPGQFEGCSCNSVECMESSGSTSYISQLSLKRIPDSELYGATYTVPSAPFAPLTP